MIADDASTNEAAENEEAIPAPIADPATCQAIAIGLSAFLESVYDGEWEGSELDYYLEPAGVTQAVLKCTRAPEKDPEPAGLLMTRAAWQAKTAFLDDGVNPETYELTFPKEFGYVKPLAHYKPETRENALYPWSKKY